MSEKIECIKKFKKAVKKIVLSGVMPGPYGICNALDDIDPYCASYSVMASLLTHNEYCEGLGRNGEFNDDRQNFILLLYTMSEKDILECWKHYEMRDKP